MTYYRRSPETRWLTYSEAEEEFQEHINQANTYSYLALDIPGVLSIDEVTPAVFFRAIRPDAYREAFETWLGNETETSDL